MSLELPKLSDQDKIHKVCLRIASHIDARGRDAITSAYDSLLPLALEKAPQIPSIVVRQTDLYEKRDFLDAVMKENDPISSDQWPKTPTVEQEFWMDRFSSLLGGIVADGFVPNAHRQAVIQGQLPIIQRRWMLEERTQDQYQSRDDIHFPAALERYAWRIEVPPDRLADDSYKFKASFSIYMRARSEMLDEILEYIEKSKKEKSKKKALVLKNIADRNSAVILRYAGSVESAVREWLRSRFAPKTLRVKPASGLSSSISIMLIGAAAGAASTYTLKS